MAWHVTTKYKQLTIYFYVFSDVIDIVFVIAARLWIINKYMTYIYNI